MVIQIGAEILRFIYNNIHDILWEHMNFFEIKLMK
jgi:hypothetical protein